MGPRNDRQYAKLPQNYPGTSKDDCTDESEELIVLGAGREKCVIRPVVDTNNSAIITTTMVRLTPSGIASMIAPFQ